MYLTAQRVHKVDGREGINVFGYSHRRRQSFSELAELSDDPGDLVFELVALPAGGNAVSSYLDVVAPEGITAATLANMVQAAVLHVPAVAGSDVHGTWSGLRIAFFASPSMHPEPAIELRALKDRLLFALGSGMATGTPLAGTLAAPAPLRIWAETDDRGRRYVLERTSEDLLSKILGPEHAPLPESLAIPFDTEADFRKLHGDRLYEEVAMVLTTLSLEQIRKLAGVEVVDKEHGRLWSLD
ncbi:MAG TPA: hypothetical protein VGH20_07655 [Myxococcales bacterium]|jgi:hypothetical protein